MISLRYNYNISENFSHGIQLTELQFSVLLSQRITGSWMLRAFLSTFIYTLPDSMCE